MKVSEKLRALDAEMKVFDAGLTELKVLEALPLIADVVEAAEWSVLNAQLVCDEEITLERRLTALREHLGAEDE